MICERCGKEVYLLEQCDYCNRKVCVQCEKSAKKTSRIRRIVICKDCWTDMKKRKVFKAE
ncbi:MAG: hypothetical protein NT130_04950 [Candidatus Micrarchaeota archaeon]|nr:hypothetical protein [Candidatus Micrarchaeota archaeon]